MALAPETYALLTAIAALAGFIDAIAGGGGLLTVPAMLSAGIPPLNVLATNKLQSVFGAVVATWNYAQKGLIDAPRLPMTVAIVFAGSLLGAWLVQMITSDVLAILVPLLLMLVAAYVLLSPRMHDEDAHQRITPGAYMPVAGSIGFYDGFFGPGTGSFFTTSLVALRGMGLTRAAAHTKLLNCTSNFAGMIMLAMGGHTVWLLGLTMALGAMGGAWLGTHTALRFGARVIRPLLIVTSLTLTGRLLYQALT